MVALPSFVMRVRVVLFYLKMQNNFGPGYNSFAKKLATLR